jgi:hypothetical protein
MESTTTTDSLDEAVQEIGVLATHDLELDAATPKVSISEGNRAVARKGLWA